MTVHNNYTLSGYGVSPNTQATLFQAWKQAAFLSVK
jgi:hypothetical protein